MKPYRKFIYIFFITVPIILCLTATFNFIMDPMWMYGHQHPFNDVQTVINERQQKTNRLHFQPFHNDSLLVGSSRTTYINQNEFKKMNVYNFAASNLSIHEYDSFIDYAKRVRKKEFKTVIIGTDFFKTSLQENTTRTLHNEIMLANQPLYRAKSLISYDLLKYSFQNLKMSYQNKVMEERDYNRDNIAFAKRISKKEKKDIVQDKVERFKEEFYGTTYKYNPNYKKVFENIKVRNPNTHFIIFTTPISAPLFQAMIDEGRLDDYERWLRDLVDVNGEVYHFMYPNSVTEDLDNFFDGHHMYPEAANLIAHKISGYDEDVPKDFGIILTNDNLDDFFDRIEKEIDVK